MFNRVLLLALAVLMAATRSSHWGTPVQLPDASLAVFFLCGFYLRETRWFALFCAEAGVIDVLAIHHGVSSFCVTAAYPFLLPTYGAVWFGGRWLRRHLQTDGLNAVRAVTAALVSISVAFLISNGSFYLLSGYFTNLNLLQYAERVARYAPRYVGTTGLYLIATAALHAIVTALIELRDDRRRRLAP